jgi:predicted site-specific integrase-resolvase
MAIKNTVNNTRQDLGFLGEEFQKRLIKLFFDDSECFKKDMGYINQNAFTNRYYRIIVGQLKDYVNDNGYIPSPDFLSSIIATSITNDLDVEIIREHLEEIKKTTTEGQDVIKRETVKFFKRQELVRFFNDQLDKLNRGYDVLEDNLTDKLNNIINIGNHESAAFHPFEGLEETLLPDETTYIPIGCPQIDAYLNGGIIKGNLVLWGASSGIGKTTCSVALAHSAALAKTPQNNNMGFKTLSFFFEDRPVAIKRKSIGAISEIEARLVNTKEYSALVKERIENHKDKADIIRNVRYQKLANGMVNVDYIKNQIKLQIQQGFKPDLVIIDYFECVMDPAVRNTKNEWKIEGYKMRQIENICSEFNVAVVVFTQGTKNSADGMLMTLDKISGSANKFQVGHMVITLNRTNKEAEENRAELFIPKNREGKSGRVFRIYLNNGIPKIIVDDFFDNIEELRASQKNTSQSLMDRDILQRSMAESLARQNHVNSPF